MNIDTLELGYRRNEMTRLLAYAQSKEKTVTQLVEDWIDRLPSLLIDDSLSTPLPNQSDD